MLMHFKSLLFPVANIRKKYLNDSLHRDIGHHVETVHLFLKVLPQNHSNIYTFYKYAL